MRWAALVISAIVMGCSAFVLVHEYPGVIFSQLKTGDMIARLAAGPVIAPVTMPLTWSGQNDVLEACILLQATLQMSLQPSDVKNNVLRACNDFGQHATARAPTVAIGYLVQAQTAAGLKDEAASNLALVRGQAFSPLEGWQALRRVDLGLQRLNLLDPAARHALDQDLTFLMATGFGSAAIARHYVTHPDHRALIEAKITDLPNAAQNRFLSDLKRAAKFVPPDAGKP